MLFRYTKWDPTRHAKAMTTFEQLMDLFQQLLQFTAGDAAEALNWLTQLDGRYGLTDEGMGIGDFIEELKRQGYLNEDEMTGLLQITARTERAIRQRSLEEVFRQLRKGGRGNHKTPYAGAGDERLPETRGWHFGDDPHLLDVTGTLSNSFRRAGIDDWNFYMVFVMFRSAAIVQGVYKRGLDGNASSEFAREYGALVRQRAVEAWALVD